MQDPEDEISIASFREIRIRKTGLRSGRPHPSRPTQKHCTWSLSVSASIEKQNYIIHIDINHQGTRRNGNYYCCLFLFLFLDLLFRISLLFYSFSSTQIPPLLGMTPGAGTPSALSAPSVRNSHPWAIGTAKLSARTCICCLPKTAVGRMDKILTNYNINCVLTLFAALPGWYESE